MKPRIHRDYRERKLGFVSRVHLPLSSPSPFSKNKGESWEEETLLYVNFNFTRVDWRNFDKKDQIESDFSFPFSSNGKTTRFRTEIF